MELSWRSVYSDTTQLAVKHILVECVYLKDVRNKHFVASSIKDVFENVEAQSIIDFIKEIRFYSEWVSV